VNKVRNAKISSSGITSPSILFPLAPETQQGIDQLKADVFSNPAYAGNLVSLDGKVALVKLGFFEETLQPRLVYAALEDLRKKYQDENTVLHIVGEPYLYGVIFSYLPQTRFFFIITVIAMLLVALVYTRSIRLIAIPLASALLCAIWGLGFMRLCHFDLDPLVLVIPLLVSATAISHSIQFNWRINEDYASCGDLKASCVDSIKALFFPGLTGVLTDGVGILLIAFIPIPLMNKLGLSIFVWCLTMIPVVLVFNPVINLFLPPMKNARAWRDARRNGWMERFFLQAVAAINHKKAVSWGIAGVFFVMAIVAYYLNLGIQVGDIREGTPILKDSSLYNHDVEFMAERLPGSMNPMLVIVEGTEEGVVKEPELLTIVDDFQAHMAKIPEVTMTLSIVNLVKGINMAFYENNPAFFLLPDSRRGVYANLHLLTSGGAEPGDYDTFYDFDFQNLNISVFCQDHMPSTIDKVLSAATSFIENHPTKLGKFNLCGGRLGIIAAFNDSIMVHLSGTLGAAMVVTGLLVAFVFRSALAGLLLIIPLSLASWFTFAYMATQNIPINLQTLPVSIISIGIGVDYGVYLLSRIREEFAQSGNMNQAISVAIGTAGNAIILTGTIIIAGVFFWIFSDIKFQAEMGLLLSIVTCFHLLGSLVLLPAMIQIIRPRFICGVQRGRRFSTADAMACSVAG
jgi:predicted RND superfamily exporter protein